MLVAIDTSVLIAWERSERLHDFLETSEADTYYVPAHAAAEYLIGTHPPARSDLRERARRLYESVIRGMVDVFDEAAAAQLAALNSELRISGKSMGFYDAAIAATVISRGHALLVLDSDFDRLKDRIELKQLSR
jgi:predicted nucleic acid-binding protein